jgi:hypothetical protein|nr:hypothetical protein [Stenotrophomonas indicatrix]
MIGELAPNDSVGTNDAALAKYSARLNPGTYADKAIVPNQGWPSDSRLMRDWKRCVGVLVVGVSYKYSRRDQAS